VWKLDGPMEDNWVGQKNDKISEIVIQKGWKIEVFRDSNFQGGSKVFEARDSAQTIELDQHGMDNKISSFKIYELPTSPAPSVTLSEPTVSPTFVCDRTTKQIPINEVLASSTLQSYKLANPLSNIVKVSGTATARTSKASTAYFYLKDKEGNTVGHLNIVPSNYGSKDGSKEFDIPLNGVSSVHMYSWWNSATLSNLVFTIESCPVLVPTLYPTPHPTLRPTPEVVAPVTLCENYGCDGGFVWKLDGPMEDNWVGQKNDKISEIVIQKGWKIEVFRDSNFQGGSKVFEARDSAQTIELDQHGMDNKISSFKIYELPTSPAPSVTLSEPTVSPTFVCDRTTKQIPINEVLASSTLQSYKLANPLSNIVKVSGTATARTSKASTAYFYLKDKEGNTVGHLNIVPSNYGSKDGSKEFDIPLNGVSSVHMYSWWNSATLSNLVFTIESCPVLVPTLYPTPHPTTSPTAIDKTDYDFIEKVPRMSQADIVKVMNWIKAEVTMVKNEFCWRRSYGRGVGKPLHTCERQGKVKIGALCYSHCPPGMKRFGFDCHSVCPSGSQDQGLFCRWNEYGRGAGFPWKFGDGFNDRGMYKRCERKHGKGKCEKKGAIVYPKCRSGYKPVGCCICRPALPNCDAHNLGGRFDLSCAKKIQIGDPTPMDCAEDEDEDAGLCYKKCRGGYNGVGPVCWGYCDDSQVDCGLGCAKSDDACFEGTYDQVLAPLILAANVASLGLAAPATATATMTIKVAGKVVAGTTRVGKAFVWVVKQLQTTGKIRKVDGKDTFVLNGLKENGFKVLTEIMDPMSMDFNEETKATIYAITDIIEGHTGTNEAKESYQAMRDYKEAFADDFAGQTSTDISDELERNFHPLTARFFKETWAEYSLTELAEAEGWETADTILTTASAVDITGVMGVVDAYAKPECNAIVPFPSTAANLL